MAKSPINIREAVKKDVEYIHNIRNVAIKKMCKSHYSLEDIDLWVGKLGKEAFLPFIEKREMIVAEVGGKVVGFGHLTADTLTSSEESKGTIMQIKGLFVEPDCGVKGVGSMIVEELENRARMRGAEFLTVHSSLNAEEFYKKFGLVPLELAAHPISEESCVQCVKMMKTL